MHKKFSNSLIFRISIMFLICVLLPSLIVISLSLGVMNKIKEEKNYIMAQDELIKFEQALWKKLYHYDSIFDTIVISNSIQNYIDNPTDITLKTSAEHFLYEYTSRKNTQYKSITFYIYGDNQFNSSDFKNFSEIQNEYWCLEFYGSMQHQSWTIVNEDNSFYLMKLMKFFDTNNNEIGVLKSLIDFNTIIQSISVVEDKFNFECFLLDFDGVPIYTNEENEKQSVIFEKPENLKLISQKLLYRAECNKKIDNTFVAAKKISDFGIIIGKTISGNGYSGEKSLILTIIILVAILLLIFTIVYYSYIIKIFTTLKSDVFLLTYYIDNDLNGKLPIRRNDEVGEIELQYNRILRKIATLKENIIQERNKFKSAEFSMLLSQIKTHYIYNTINCLRMQAEVDQCYEVANNIAKFGKILRYYVLSENVMTSIGDELDTISYYLEIESLKIQNIIEFDFEIDPPCREITIPKLIIQPLVENSIKYGRVPNRKLKINITVTRETNHLTICVKDNGNGVDKNTFKTISNQLLTPSFPNPSKYKDSTKIGLKNIALRLYSHYGNDAKLTIESRENFYFSAKIIIPLR